MASRLPTVGGDNGNWGAVLNDYLSRSHKPDGSLRADVASIADLKTLDVSQIPDKMQAMVGGYYAHGDGGGGQFYYDAGASDADNGGTVIAPTAGSGRWKRIYSGAVNVLWFGAKGDDVTNNTAAFAAAIKASQDVVFPVGIFLLDTLVIDKNMHISGAGRKLTKIKVSSFGTYQGIKYGVLSRGAVTSPVLSDHAAISGIDFEITSTEPGQKGILITRKTNLADCYIHGATSDGVYFLSVSPNAEAPYLNRFDSVWMKFNGGNGATITENCNAMIFVDCQWASNGAHGLHQFVSGNGQPTVAYNTVIIGGQTAYNDFHGMYFQHGSNTQVYGTYAERNSDIDGGNPKTGAYKNVQLGAGITRSRLFLGEQGTDVDVEQTIGLNTVTDNFVSIGGKVLTPSNTIDMGVENVGSGKSIVFHGALDCVHEIRFREVLTDRLRWKYDGVTNNLTLDAWNTTAWVNALTVTSNGTIAFFGGTPRAKQTVTGSRGGNAALASMLTALANLGLITDDTTV